MSNESFYGKPFDEETEIKLILFRKYIREWLPVFLVKGTNDYIKEVVICDFFAGKGQDTLGKSGSPMIILEEIRSFYEKHTAKASMKSLRVVFNDQDKESIKHLRSASEQLCEQVRSLHSNTEFDFENTTFGEC